MANKLPPEVQAILNASDAGFYATTVQLLKPYLENNPDSQRGWIDYGHALGNLARYREAEVAYQRAIELTEEADRDSIYGTSQLRLRSCKRGCSARRFAWKNSTSRWATPTAHSTNSHWPKFTTTKPSQLTQNTTLPKQR